MNHAIVSDWKMTSINEDDRINTVEWSVLPLFYILQDLICNIGDETLTAFKAIDLFYLVRYLPCCQSSGIHTYDLIINTGNVLLTILDHLWFKSSIPVLRNIYLELSVVAAYRFSLCSISIVIWIKSFGFFIAKMIGHFSFHHRFDRSSQKIFESCLYVIRCLNFILIH